MMIKNKDIKRIVQSYQVFFPDWIIIDCDMLVRAKGPVLQGISFYRLSSNHYSPRGFIRVLSLPNATHPLIMELPQLLIQPNGANRTIGVRSLENVISETVAELRKQILPAVNQPLEPEKVLTLYTKLAIPTHKEAFSLASLSAYYGYSSDAIHWIGQYEQLMNERKTHGLVSETDREDEQFLKTLAAWLEQGIARDRLEMIVEEEKRKLGILKNV